MKKIFLLIIGTLSLINVGIAQWHEANNGLYGGRISALTVDPATNYVYAGGQGGVYLSKDNGSTWETINNGFTNRSVHSIAINGGNIFASTYNGVFLSSDNGNSWTAMNNGSGSGFSVNSLAISGDNIFAGTWDGVFLSTDNGSSWTSVKNGLSGNGLSVFSFAISGSNIFAGTLGGGLYLSTNNGSSWTPVNNGLTSGSVLSLAINGSNVFAGTGKGVFLSTDNGSSWTAVNNGLSGNGLTINALTISGDNIFIGTNSGVYLSIDNGSNWTALNNGLSGSGLRVQSIAVRGSNIFAGTKGGVFLSTNNGSTWTLVNDGLSGLSLDVSSIALIGSDIFAGTRGGGGIWKRLLSDIATTHFVPVWWPDNGMDHMNLYALTAKHDNVDLQPGDEVGIFDGTACVGMGTITQVLNGTTVILSMVASKDDPGTPLKDGYTSGNSITYKVWDLSESKEVSNIPATYVSGVGIFSPGTSAAFNLTAFCCIMQDISLTAGWNLMSFAVEPDIMFLMSIVTPLKNAGTLQKIQDEKGNAIEQLPAPIGWVDNIGLMKVSEGYKIKVSDNTTLSVTGKPVNSPFIITLEAGWNIMGYPCLNPKSAWEVFKDLIASGCLIKVQDEKGNAIEKLPDPIGWIDNIHTLMPGKAYKVKVCGNVTITIICNDPTKGMYQNGISLITKPSHFKPAYTGNGFDHMNIYLKEATIGGAGIKPGDEIGVFDGGVCVGAVVVEDPNSEYLMMTASLDDPTTTDTDGFITGHNFTLKLWDRQSGIERNTQNVQFEKGSGRLFERLGTSVLAVDFETKSNTSLGDAYPNPSTDKTTFTFLLAGESKVRFEIYNMEGDLIRILVDETLAGGTHHIEWDNQSTNGTRASSGIYFYRLSLNNFLQTKQLVIH